MVAAMDWATRFRIRQNLKGSLWFAPLLAVVGGAVLAAGDVALEQRITLPVYWQYSPSTASTVLTTIVGAMVALTGFVITVSVLVVQTATSTFSARYMRVWYRDRLFKALLAVLLGALSFSFALLRRVSTDFVPNLGVTTAGALVIAALLVFLFFFDRCLHRLRPVAVAAVVSDLARSAFRDGTPATPAPPVDASRIDAAPAFVVRARRAGAIQAVDEAGLVQWAKEHDCVLVFRRSVGDFVALGAPLIEVVGAVEESDGNTRALAGRVALGIERTIEQDVAFALRTLADIAEKALSAAINDPTTAVQVAGHLEELLRMIGTSDLTGHERLTDDEGKLRVVLSARRWEDYLALAVTEIREYGGGSIQVVRRLRALLEDLHDDVLPQHRPAVEDELRRLDATVAERFGDSIDLDRASIADRQGIGAPGTSSQPATSGERATPARVAGETRR